MTRAREKLVSCFALSFVRDTNNILAVFGLDGR